MSTSAITPLSPADSVLASTLDTTTATQIAVNNAGDTGSNLANASTPPSPDPLTQDVVQLLKALVSGDVSGAQNDLNKLKADLKAQSGVTASSNLSQDATSLLKALSAGDTSAAQSDVSKIQQDLQTQEASGSSPVTPLDELVGKLSTALNSGSTTTALQDLASFLVQNGQGTGSLVNTTA